MGPLSSDQALVGKCVATFTQAERSRRAREAFRRLPVRIAEMAGSPTVTA